jgi:sulfide:quinone oxidoreductase
MMRRRTFLRAGLAAMAAAGSISVARAQNTSSARPRIVIAGAGAAGISLASRLRRQVDRAAITIIDAKREHHFQPGFTLIAAGLWSPSDVTDQNASYLPRDIDWLQESVAEFNPDSNRVVTSAGRVVPYDYLFVATGLTLDYAAIEGMEAGLIGKDGIGSVYAGPAQAASTATAIDRFVEQGGTGLFTRPASEMKCAGAPLKMAFITEDKARRRGRRNAVKIVYNAHNDAVFAVKPVHDKVKDLFRNRDIAVNYAHVLTGIDPGKRRARFRTPQGPVELGYDFIHVVPPMRAPDSVRNSPLPWRSGPLAADGWVEVDKPTLRHLRYPNVFAVGDVAGVPRGKTAASVKWQVPVVVDGLVSELNGRPSTAIYNGYTSCPMVTQYGRAMLIEFDYDGKLVPSFPFIEPLDELWISWVIEEKGLRAVYRSMLRGHG